MLAGEYALTIYEGDGSAISFKRDGSSGVYYPFLSYGDHSAVIKNEDNTYTHVEKDGENRNYNAEGKLTSIVDRNGNASVLGYTDGDLTSITDSAGRTTALSYDANHRIIQITGPDISKTVTFAYTTDGYLNSITDALGNTWYYTYDSAGRMLTKTDPSNFTTAYTYYSNGKFKTSEDPEGRTKTITYNPSTNTATMTEKDGGVWTHTYDATLFVPLQDTDPLGSITTYTYDSNRNRISQTDPNGNTTTYTYDPAGNMTSMTDPLGNVTSYTYNIFGEITSITDALGNTTTTTYDSAGNLLTTTEPSGAITQYTYDSRGNVLASTDGAGRTTSYAYDQYDNLSSITDPSGEITTFVYDISGNMIRMTDAAGKITRYTYNALDRLLSVTDPMGNVTYYTYDPKGNAASVTDPEGNTTWHIYNYNNEQTEVIDALGNITNYTYGASACPSCSGGSDKLTAVTDSENHTVYYEYDLLGRLKTMTDQIGRTETYTYYANGNLHTVTDRKGRTTAYTYDAASRMTRVDYADGSYTTYAYDATGKVTTITDSLTGIISYTYTTASSGMPLGLVLTETTPLGSISYTYDSIGRRTSMTVAGQPAVNYNYDSDSRLTGISATINGVVKNFTIGYDALGRRTTLTMPNGVTTSYAYDDGSHVLNMAHLNPAQQVLESLTYTYDANGNRISMDRLNMPVKSSNPVTNTLYNAANQQLAFNDKNITYDENGNMTSVTNACGTTNYSWNARNQLVGINGFKADCSALSASFKYDVLGRRIEKTVNGDTTQYLYDGLDIVQEIKSGSPYANYIRSLSIDEPLARIKSDGTIRYYQADALGSVIALTDETGTIRIQYTYDPFGNTNMNGESSDNPFQYTGRENDWTGLYDYRARYYSPELQRWVSEDPIRLRGGINFFAYTGDNPVNRKDPSGLAFNDCDLIKTQEKEACRCLNRWCFRGYVCNQALLTCQSNCDHYIDPAGDSVTRAQCREDCGKAWRKCLAGKCFKFPDYQKKDCQKW